MRKLTLFLLIIAIAVFIFPLAVMTNQRASPAPAGTTAITDARDLIVTGDQITATDMYRVVTFCTVDCTIVAEPKCPSVTMAKITAREVETVQSQTTYMIKVVTVTVPEPQLLVNAINSKRGSSLFVALVDTRTVAVNYGGPVTKFTSSSLSAMAYNQTYLRTGLGHLRI